MNMSFFNGIDGKLPTDIPNDSRLECKICWYVYDPEFGDEQGQIPKGTAFTQLPDDWRCPECDADKHSFLLIND